MPNRISLSQIQSKLRQAQSKQKQAIDAYNRQVRAINDGRKRAIENYNRAVRSHNQRVRINRAQFEQALSRLRNAANTTTSLTVSARSVHAAFVHVEKRQEAGASYPGHLFSMFEEETAFSMRAANAIDSGDRIDPSGIVDLQSTTLDEELAAFSPDLVGRWKGALFALSPRNPDAARHFCTSARECIVTALDLAASDREVEIGLPACEFTNDGRLSRRSKLKYLLVRSGMADKAVEDFVNRDVEDILSLFRVFNDGTHGRAGRFDFNELLAVKQRAENGIRFLHELAQ